MTTNSKAPPKFGRGAEVRAASYDESDNSVEVIWTTGASVKRRDWRTGNRYNEILEVTPEAVRLDRLNAGAPLLDTHDDWSLRSIIGVVVAGSARIEDGVGYARVRLSSADGDSDAVSKIRDGIIRNISVGYAIHRVEKTEKDDGTDEDWRVVDWEPMEISAVPIPADAGSQFRSAEEEMPTVEFISPDTEADLSDATPAADPAANTETTPTKEARVSDANTETRAAPAIDEAAVTRTAEDSGKRAAETAMIEERKRAKEIRQAAKDVDQAALGETLVDEGATVSEARQKLWDAMVEARKEMKIDTRAPAHVGVEHAEKRAQAIEGVIMNRINPAANAIPEGAREFRGMTLVDMAREVLEANGVNTRGMSKDEIAGEAMSQRGAGGMHSTSDFPIILGNTVNRTLRAAYELAPQTFRPLVRETTVSDFKEVTRAQLGEAPRLERVNEHGEYKRGTVGEGSEKYRVYKFGKIIGITREAIVNDDLDAFTRLSQMFGLAAAQLESDLVWGEILSNPTMGDGVTLFHATHKNLASAAAFGETPIGKMRAAMAKQVGLDGKTVLNIRPSFVLVPMDLEIAAEKLLNTTYMPAKTDDAVAASVRSLTPISEPRLDEGFVHPVTGATISGSSTAYYLASAPGSADTVELAYLNGQRGVYTDSRMAFNTDGIEIKARMEVGAKVIDWRAFQKNPGQ